MDGVCSVGLDGSTAGGWALSVPVRALVQVAYTHHEGDDPGNSGDESHTAASTSVYVSPGLRAQITPGIAALGFWQVRVYEHTDGPLLIAPYHLVFGLSYSL